MSTVVLQEYEVTASDARSPLGQTALLTCHVPAHVRAAVKVTSWGVDDTLNVYPTLFGGGSPGGRLIGRSAGSCFGRRREGGSDL